MNLGNSNVVVALFVMEGCGACHEYLPRFQRIAEPYRRAGIPVLIFDAASEDPEIEGLADRWGVYATPTTVIARRGPGMIREEGNLDDASLGRLFDAALRCAQTGRL